MGYETRPELDFRYGVMFAAHAKVIKTGILLALCIILLPNRAGAILGGFVARTAAGDNTKSFTYLWGYYGLPTYASASSDFSNNIANELAEVTLAGSNSAWNTEIWTNAAGLGVEPMAYAHAETKYFDPSVPTQYRAWALAVAAITVRHLVQAKPDAPGDILNLINTVPVTLTYRLSASGGVIIPDGPDSGNASAYFGITGPGIDDGRSVENNQSRSGTLSFQAPYGNGVIEYDILRGAEYTLPSGRGIPD